MHPGGFGSSAEAALSSPKALCKGAGGLRGGLRPLGAPVTGWGGYAHACIGVHVGEATALSTDVLFYLQKCKGWGRAGLDPSWGCFLGPGCLGPRPWPCPWWAGGNWGNAWVPAPVPNAVPTLGWCRMDTGCRHWLPWGPTPQLPGLAEPGSIALQAPGSRLLTPWPMAPHGSLAWPGLAQRLVESHFFGPETRGRCGWVETGCSPVSCPPLPPPPPALRPLQLGTAPFCPLPGSQACPALVPTAWGSTYTFQKAGGATRQLWLCPLHRGGAKQELRGAGDGQQKGPRSRARGSQWQAAGCCSHGQEIGSNELGLGGSQPPAFCSIAGIHPPPHLSSGQGRAGKG